MPESDSVHHHYYHIQEIHARLREHSWSRQQTKYDSEFIAWLDKAFQHIANEAYELTLGR